MDVTLRKINTDGEMPRRELIASIGRYARIPRCGRLMASTDYHVVFSVCVDCLIELACKASG
jgi:hypothetical protein